MPVKNKRVRTGCVTCRQRRVKCDERKPICERCQAANVYCRGYDGMRHLESKIGSSAAKPRRTNVAITSPETHPPLTRHRPDGLPLVGCPTNPPCTQGPPHQRARAVLAHHQFTFRTARILFREDHLYFWRDQILQTAWDTEYVYDVVVALGTVHRASLLLSQSHDRWKGLDTKVIALQMYGDALRQVSRQFEKDIEPRDILIAVLLLLAYFECFVGNPVAAFRHLRAATHYFAAAQFELRQHNSTSVEPLRSCIAQLALVAQVVLPLPSIPFFREMTAGISYTTDTRKHSMMGQRLELLNIVTTYKDVNRAIWAPLSGVLGQLDSLQISAFQAELLRWRDASNNLFQACDDEAAMSSIPSSTWASLDRLSIPPDPQNFPSVDAAVTAALYNCFMAQTMWLLSITTSTSHPYEIAAYLYTYQNLRIAESLLNSVAAGRLGEDPYLPCEALNLGLSATLYLSARCCYNSTWQHWLAEKLRVIGQEGLFNSEAFATCLDILQSYQHTPRNTLPICQENASPSRSPLGSPVSRIIPTLLPGLDGREFIGYYVQFKPGFQNNCGGRRLTPQLVGRASWQSEDTDSLERKRSMGFNSSQPAYKRTSDIDVDVDVVVGTQSVSSESVVKGWESLLQGPAFQMDTGLGDYINDFCFLSKAKSSHEV